jgi:hypothetical protein
MAMKYVGQGAFIHGVPARDLNDDEAKRFGDEIREQQALTGLVMYEEVQAVRKVAPAPKIEGKEGE